MAYLIMLVGVCRSLLSTGMKVYLNKLVMAVYVKKNRPIFWMKQFIELSPNSRSTGTACKYQFGRLKSTMRIKSCNNFCRL